MHTRVLAVLLLCLLATPGGADERLREAWKNYLRKPTQRGAETLLDAGAPSLEELVDLLYPRLLAGDAAARVKQLVERLGHRRYPIREKATLELIKMGSNVAGELARYREHEDPEVRGRVAAVLRAVASKKIWYRTQRRRLLQLATALLHTEWPLPEVQQVARTRIEQLMRAPSVEYDWNYRALAPLLASLRVSKKASDRALLTRVVRKGAPGAAEAAMGVLVDGLRQRPGPLAKHWRAPLPAHDYGALFIEILDPKRPQVFESAMYAAPRNDALRAKLRASLKTANPKLRRRIAIFLWHFMRDPVARNHFVAALDSSDAKVFADAVKRLTDRKFADQGETVIPALARVLARADAARRLVVIQNLNIYDEGAPRTLAIAALAPLLVSPVPAERKAAASSLIGLEGYGKRNTIFKWIAAKHANPAVRKAAAKLHAARSN